MAVIDAVELLLKDIESTFSSFDDHLHLELEPWMRQQSTAIASTLNIRALSCDCDFLVSSVESQQVV